jgi:hypothetical protein
MTCHEQEGWLCRRKFVRLRARRDRLQPSTAGLRGPGNHPAACEARAYGTPLTMLRGDALSDPGEVLTLARRGDEAAGLTAAATARLQPQGRRRLGAPRARRARLAALDQAAGAPDRWAIDRDGAPCSAPPEMREPSTAAKQNADISTTSRLDPTSTGHHTARSAAHHRPPCAARPAGRFRLRFPASTRSALGHSRARRHAAGCDGPEIAGS